MVFLTHMCSSKVWLTISPSSPAVTFAFLKTFPATVKTLSNVARRQIVGYSLNLGITPFYLLPQKILNLTSTY